MRYRYAHESPKWTMGTRTCDRTNINILWQEFGGGMLILKNGGRWEAGFKNRWEVGPRNMYICIYNVAYNIITDAVTLNNFVDAMCIKLLL